MLRVKEICKQQGITLKELAERMNISPEALTRILSSNGNPTLSTMMNLSKALRIEIYELFEDFNEEKKVKGYLEIEDKIHKINSFSDLQAIYKKLKEK
jgi:transcriptional regulator with XRE-family HTH domain